jgi:hypothetical protein
VHETPIFNALNQLHELPKRSKKMSNSILSNRVLGENHLKAVLVLLLGKILFGEVPQSRQPYIAAWKLMSTFSLFDGSVSRLFEVVPESGSGVLLERTGTGTGNRLSGGI